MCCRADLDPPMEEPPTCGLAITLCPLAGDEPQQRAALSADAVDQHPGPTRRKVTVVAVTSTGQGLPLATGQITSALRS
jgi:hypothetical protein